MLCHGMLTAEKFLSWRVVTLSCLVRLGLSVEMTCHGFGIKGIYKREEQEKEVGRIYVPGKTERARDAQRTC